MVFLTDRAKVFSAQEDFSLLLFKDRFTLGQESEKGMLEKPQALDVVVVVVAYKFFGGTRRRLSSTEIRQPKAKMSWA